MANEALFTFSSIDIKANKVQLLDGFTIIESKIDIQNYFEENLISCFLNYVTKFTDACYGTPNVALVCRFFTEHHFDLVLIKLNEYFSKCCACLTNVDEATDASAVEKRKTNIFVKTQDLLNFMLDNSRKFSLKMCETGSLGDWCEYLRNDEFLKRFARSRVLDVILMNLSLLSRDVDLYKVDWVELNVVGLLRKVAHMDSKLKTDAYGTILRVASDQQFDEITDEIFEIASKSIRLLHTAAAHIAKLGNSLPRHKIEYQNVEQKTRELDAYYVPDDENPNDSWDTTALMNTLYKLAVNNKIKLELFDKLRDAVKSIVLKGTEIEKRYALRLLAQLCFEPRVAAIVSKDAELVKTIRSLCNNSKLTLKSISATSKQIMWLLNSVDVVRSTAGFKYTPKSVMISGDLSTKDLSAKIKTELEKGGYKVWLDNSSPGQNANSSIVSKTSAIETSEFILLLITEKYRQSVSCQCEAQYAFKMQKQIVPVIMQNSYENVSGWLREVICDRACVDFSKCFFDDAVNKLLNRMVLMHDSKEHVPSVDEDKKPFLPSVYEHKKNVEVSTPTSNSVVADKPKASQRSKTHPSQWSEEEVRDWFAREQTLSIYNLLKPCNGDLLYELYEFQAYTPKFFYEHIISEMKSADRRSLVIFSRNLKKLFGPKILPKESFFFSPQNVSYFFGLVFGIVILVIIFRFIKN